MPSVTKRGGGRGGEFSDQPGELWKPTPSVWTPKQTGLVASTYSKAYRRTPEHLRQAGADFYPTWHEDAQHIGAATGLGHEAGAAILAHLSPANEAEQNRIQALQLTHGVSDKQEGMLRQAGEHAAAAKSFEVQSRSHPAGSVFHQEYEYHQAENARLRQKSGIVGTPLGGLGSREISNALSVRAGEHADPLSSLGKLKIRDFGGLIADPGASRVPIDTHFHDAGLGRTDIPYASSRGLTSVGRYEHFQGAAEVARQRTSRSVGADISPADFMGGIWYGHQQAKVQANPDARKARMAAETKLGNIRASKVGSQFLPEKFGLRPSFGKIDTGR